MKLHLHRMGADPEMLVGRASEDFEFQTQNANRALFGGAGANGAAFIGLDGHAFTAELRPPPARNINLLLYHIAQGLLTTQEFLNRQHPGHVLLARPKINDETMGGHIHLSFYPETPPIQHEVAARYGYFMRDGVVLHRDGVVLPRGTAREIQELVLNEAGQMFDLGVFTRKLNWLVLPLEYWAQPWFSRRNRNAQYGGPNDVRVTTHPATKWPPMGGMDKKYPYMHVEYRAPSTWLVHPRLAYLYLSLAKVVVLNYDSVPSSHMNWNARHETPGNDRFRDMLLEHWHSRTWRQSADTRAIDQNLLWLSENRAALWRPNVGVDIEAWRGLFNKKAALEIPEPEDDPEMDVGIVENPPQEEPVGMGAALDDGDFDDEDYDNEED